MVTFTVTGKGRSDCLVTVAGVLDVSAVSDLRLRMHAVVDGGSGPVLLDLAQCVVRDSTGFGLLVETMERARRAGRPLRIVAADDRTRRLLCRARLGRLLVCVSGCRRPHEHRLPESDLVPVG